MALKNWCYGAKTPDIEQAVSDAIFLAHRYRNTLCSLELEKRKRHYEILRELAPCFVLAEQAVESAEKELGAVRELIQEERVRQRSKTPTGIQSITTRASEIKSKLKELRASLKQSKLSAYADPKVIAAMDANTARHKADASSAKQSSGLYWGTEAIVKSACASFASGSPPRFKRYDGEGQLAVQLQGGIDCDDAMRPNTLCYIEHINGRKSDCLIRIGSESGKPVFARVPIIFHRDLPAGKIKWAYLERRKIADHVRWTIRLTIDCESETDRCIPGNVAIHTGWRMEQSGLRVATWLGSDGKCGVFRLSKEHCADYATLDQIRSKRDVAFNQTLAELREWLKGREVPDWLAEDRKHLHLWKSKARLSNLYWRWSESRFDGDEEMFSILDQWRKPDKHLWQHEQRLAVRIARRRKNEFRNFLAALADQYGVAFVSPIDAKLLTENSLPEELERDNTLSHRHAKWAAVSELTQCIREKFPLHCVEVSSINISRQCSRCGCVENEIHRRKIQCANPGCNRTFDIDDNAVKNTLARGQAAVKNGALLELKAEQEDKATKQAEKLAKMQAANRAARETKRKQRHLHGEIV